MIVVDCLWIVLVGRDLFSMVPSRGTEAICPHSQRTTEYIVWETFPWIGQPNY